MYWFSWLYFVRKPATQHGSREGDCTVIKDTMSIKIARDHLEQPHFSKPALYDTVLHIYSFCADCDFGSKIAFTFCTFDFSIFKQSLLGHFPNKILLVMIISYLPHVLLLANFSTCYWTYAGHILMQLVYFLIQNSWSSMFACFHICRWCCPYFDMAICKCCAVAS